jgi:hypothetical protein
MAIVAGSSGLYALYDASEKYHRAVRQVLTTEPGAVIIPTVILAEVDYLLREHLGIGAELDFLDGIREGAYTIESPTSVDLNRCRDLIAQYRDLDLGLADASVMATAARLGIDRILTLDQRHFRSVVSKSGRPFRLLPFDRK